MKPIIELCDVTYSYPGAERPVLSGCSLAILEGEFLLICGPSGSGKSTLLRLMNGLIPHFYGGRLAGQILVGGRDTRVVEPRNLGDLVGFVFQDPESQFVVEIVEDELAFAMENAGLPPRTMRRRVEEALDQVEIAHLRHRPLATLSGGERQRVAIAAALTVQPRVLLLDEPTSQLDPHTAEEVLTALQKLNADLGLTIVLSEHRLERVIQYADRMLYLQPGGPALSGTPREVLAGLPLPPPLADLARRMGWTPLPLTIKEGRRFASQTFQASSETTRNQKQETKSVKLNSAGRDTRAAGQQSPLVVVEQLWAEYDGITALQGISLELRAGEVLAIMGRNGSGKTTLLRHIVGLARPRRGNVRVVGKDIAHQPVEEIARTVGYVPQQPGDILYHATLAEELRFTLRSHRIADGGDRRVVETLAELGLEHLANADPRDLSGGEAQRAALAAILVAQPRVLLLDEPTRGLDYAAKWRLADLLRQLAANNRGIIVVSHDVEFVARCADRILLLGEGELVVDGPAEEVLGDSLLFSTQIGKLFPGRGWLTLEQALEGLQVSKQNGATDRRR